MGKGGFAFVASRLCSLRWTKTHTHRLLSYSIHCTGISLSVLERGAEGLDAVAVVFDVGIIAGYVAIEVVERDGEVTRDVAVDIMALSLFLLPLFFPDVV